MAAPGWLSRSPTDVPAGVGWLGPRERAVHAALQLPRRRADWRLGRWTAKCALAAWLGGAPDDVEVLAAADGAPEAWCGRRRLPVVVSLSHRAGRAIAVVADAPAALGCDLELAEPRSDAFLREWLGEAERAQVAAAGDDGRTWLANLVWSAKEAGAKARREGLRLDVRSAAVRVGRTPAADGWAPLDVRWAPNDGGGATPGWWRTEPHWVMAVAGEPAPAPPVRLD
ncbi:MAG: 4'-phosphopantetheinyl transferase superfamily protein [Solirubrobacterales bacterium]|nr:4'-phosphopantetheinyl transferase superfamily protein [Solirubrobacterales bacterium]